MNETLPNTKDTEHATSAQATTTDAAAEDTQPASNQLPVRAELKVRLDKWLQIARAFKTRSQATLACTLGRIRVNGDRVKPHRIVALNDRIQIEMRNDWKRILVVAKLADKPVAKALAAELFIDESPPKPTADPMARLMRKAPVVREAGAGRPTKRDRRKLDRLREG